MKNQCLVARGPVADIGIKKQKKLLDFLSIAPSITHQRRFYHTNLDRAL